VQGRQAAKRAGLNRPPLVIDRQRLEANVRAVRTSVDGQSCRCGWWPSLPISA